MKLNELTFPKGYEEHGPQDYKLFVDLDGVLVDFAKKAAEAMDIPVKDFPKANRPKDKVFDNKLWSAVRKYRKTGKPFWSAMDKLPDANKLWNYVEIHDPEILTAAGDISSAHEEKREWVKKHLGSDVVVNIVQHTEEKGKYAENNYILIDDRQRSIDAWTKAGGIGILHTSAADTIKQLKELGI